MATSGNFLTSDSGQGGGNYYGRLIFEWWQVSSGISGSVGYHGINYHLKTYGGSGSYYQWLYNCSMNVDGAGYSRGNGPAYGGGQVVLGDYGNTLYTNSSGDRSFGASAQGGIYYNTINTSGSGGWSLDHINLWGGVDYINVPSPLTDESGAITVGWHHYTGTAHLWYRLDQIDSGDSTFHYAGMGQPHTFSGYQSWLQSKMTGTNNSVLYIYYGDDIDNNGSVDNWQGPWTYNVSIANDTGQANPIFTTFTYSDTNGTTTAITGNNQVLIQGKSVVNAVILAANKAVAQKQATMFNYTGTIGAAQSIMGWSSSSTVNVGLGSVADVSGVQNLSITAFDSRFNSTTVTKSVTVLPYESPAFTPLLTIGYTNNYDYQDGLTVTANGTTLATVSPMTLSGTDKNSVNTSTGIQFDVSKGNNSSYTGTWTNVTTARASGSPNVTTTLATLASSILAKMGTLTFDNSIKWYVKFKIVDVLETQTYETSIDIGKAIFRIGTDNKLYNKEEQIMVLPMISAIADNVVAGITGGTGTITPYVIAPVYVKYGTGVGNSSTVLFDINFDFTSSSVGMRTWALKVDGTVIGSAARSAFVQTANVRTRVVTQIAAIGLAIGFHTVQIEIYGGGSNVSADTACFATVVATEWANSHTPLTSGPLYAGTVVDGGGGGNVWSNPSNAVGVDNGTTADVLEGPGGGGGFANQLVSSNHGFNIPGNATITGIVMEAKVFGINGAQDFSISIGTNTKRSTSVPNMGHSWFGPGSLNWITFGSLGQLWGRTDWSPSDINNPQFGASISAFETHSTGNDSVDAFRITVYYV